MRKCVKITITEFGDLDALYKVLKKKLSFDDLEGYAEPVLDDELHIVVYGPKEAVDLFVGNLEDVLLAENENRKHDIVYFFEPFLKDEDYRGVFRFVKKA
jgi:hypothetical protein